jgi:hypothetical protein
MLLPRQFRAEDYQVGKTLVCDYWRERRRRRAEVYIPLIHRAGEDAAAKLIWLVLRNIVQARWKNPPITWQAAKAQLAIQFEDRFLLTERAVAPLASYRRASLRAGTPSRDRALRAPARSALDRDCRSGWMVIMQSPLATAALFNQSLLTARTRNS